MYQEKTTAIRVQRPMPVPCLGPSRFSWVQVRPDRNHISGTGPLLGLFGEEQGKGHNRSCRPWSGGNRRLGCPLKLVFSEIVFIVASPVFGWYIWLSAINAGGQGRTPARRVFAKKGEATGPFTMHHRRLTLRMLNSVGHQ